LKALKASRTTNRRKENEEDHIIIIFSIDATQRIQSS
jgi:hypothetical protein